MATDTKTREFLQLEREFWDAMKNKDGATAGRLTADECVVVGPQGVAALNPEMMTQMTKEGAWTLEHYEFDPESVEVQSIADNVAVVAYKVKERIVVDGQKLSLQASDSSVWVKGAGGWRCAMHTESLFGDPYGRDRK